MELVLSLVLLQVALGMVAVQVVQYGAAAVAGLCFIALIQLFTIWMFRHQCPDGASKSVTHVVSTGNIALWTLFCVVCLFIMIVLEAIFLSPPTRLILFVKIVTSHWYGWLAVVFIIPIIEEIVFRAILIELFIKKFHWQIAVALSAAAFGLIHGNIFQAIVATIFGIIFGIAYVKTKSLWPGVTGHVLVNAYTCWRLSSVAAS